MELSIIIVNYNVTHLLRACLQSIQRFATDICYEIIVADNHSPDTSWKILKEEFPSVRFLEFNENKGFSKANNEAVSYAKGEYILLLNPDTELKTNGLYEVLNFAKNTKNLGCLGVRMYNALGNFLPESKRSVPNFKNAFRKIFLPFALSSNQKSYYRNDIAETDIAEVEVLTGAFLLMKKEIYEEVGGLDERYFMYGEDIDICYSALQKGYKNYYYGAYSILHHKGQSTVKNKKYLDNFYGAMQIFLKKYYSENQIIYYFLLLGIKTKYLMERWKI